MMQIDPAQVFSQWAPPASPWAAWVKPVLFAQLRSYALPSVPRVEWTAPQTDWCPAADGKTAVIVDLPGADALQLGVALAHRGYRPLPLFNSAPGGPNAVIDTTPLLAGILAATPELAALGIARLAPPVFLLDAERFPRLRATAGRFDNAWVVFAQDFPSARFLVGQGITQVCWCRRTRGRRRRIWRMCCCGIIWAAFRCWGIRWRRPGVCDR